MPCRADGLGMGVLAALLVRNPMFRDQAIRHRKLIYGASLLLLIAIFLIGLDRQDLIQSLILWLGIFSSGLVLPTGFVNRCYRPRPIHSDIVLQWDADETGSPCIRDLFVSLHFHSVFSRCAELGQWETFAGVVVGARVLASGGAIVLAALSWRFFEKPLLRRGHACRF